MTPEQLQAWQPQASPEQLTAFSQAHATLLQLLAETWQQFDQHYHTPPEPVEYAPDIDINQLTLSPLLPKEDQQFQQDFLQVHDADEPLVNTRHDRPLGDNPIIQPLIADLVPLEAETTNRLSTVCLDKTPLAESLTMPILPHTPQATPIQQASYPPTNLPNAKQGEAYYTLLSHSMPDVIDHVRFIPEDCGLQWHADDQAIAGVPTLHGDVQVILYIKQAQHISPINYILYVNPDPKSLWRNVPSDPNSPFHKPDHAHQQYTTPHGTLLAARVRGRSHAHLGTCCDDHFSLHYHAASQLHLLAVSDGAGSATYSRYGSQLAVEAACQTILTLLNDTNQPYQQLPTITEQDSLHQIINHLFTQAVYAAYKAHHQAVQQYDLIPDTKSLSCTLLIAFTLPLANGYWLNAAYWVGDGAVALWQPDQSTLQLLGVSDSGTYSGETRFLTAEETAIECVQRRVHIHISEHASTLILMTDGVSDPKFDTEANLAKAEYWQQLWQELTLPLSQPEAAHALQTWLDFWSPGNHDDRTLALFVPDATQSHTTTESTCSHSQDGTYVAGVDAPPE